MAQRARGTLTQLLRIAGRIGARLLSLGARADLGRRGESAAARHLRGQGLRILARNFRARSGEIDLVALDGGTLVLVEVKSGVASERWDPILKIGPAKARRIRRAAVLYRKIAGIEFPAVRIDGVAVDFVRGPLGRMRAARIRWYPGLYSVDDLGR